MTRELGDWRKPNGKTRHEAEDLGETIAFERGRKP